MTYRRPRAAQRVTRRVAVAIIILGLAGMQLISSSPTSQAQTAVGGPVILGGDDLTDHGSFNTSTGQNQAGWLYLQRALENIKPKVTKVNDNSVAALGSAPSTSTCCDAGAAIGRAASAAGLTVTYHEGAAAIDAFFAAVRAGTATPAIVWIAGTDAANDLDTSEQTALANNATNIGDFVNAGGGLMSHGTAYGWLAGLLPGATTVCCGSSGDLYLTPEGQSAFPGITNADVNAGPWHNHFEGNLGGLQVLVRSSNVNDSQGNDAPVVIGGASVILPGSISLDPPTATNLTGTNHTVTATVRNNQGALASGVLVTFSVVSGPNAGASGSGTTDASGTTTFTYTGTGGPGTDTIEASFVDTGGITRTATATKTWEAPPDPITMTGRAFGLSVQVLSATVVPPTPDTGPVSTPDATAVVPPCVAGVPGTTVSASVLCASVTTTVEPHSATAHASVAKVKIALPGLPLITAQAVEATSTTTCGGSTGTILIKKLTIGTMAVGTARVAPNRTINLGIGKIILNEQVPVPGGLTVNAIHVIIPGVADVIVSSATSDIHHCPVLL